MNEPTLSAGDLLAWLEKTSNGWRQLFTTNPELLAIPCDIMAVQTVAQLVQHIVAVELRYAERLSELPATDYANIPFESAESLYATHDRAIALYRELLASDIDWNSQMEFTTRAMGPARCMRKTVLFHAILHGVRHYAQLATIVRQHGIKPGWGMDYLLMDLEPA
jgi:uncharacterized damage-inducible protein DinB